MIQQAFFIAGPEAAGELLDLASSMYEEATNKRSKKWRKPSREQIKSYLADRETTVDPDKFFDYYEAQGWLLKNGLQMKDWKAAISQWERNDREKGIVPKRNGVTVPQEPASRVEEKWDEAAVRARIDEEAKKFAHLPKIRTDYE